MVTDISELERDALDDAVRVSRLLRQTHAAATRLGDTVMAEWATRELSGYEGDEECPDYRHVHGTRRLHCIAGRNGATRPWRVP
jgi:hypothetical protein